MRFISMAILVASGFANLSRQTVDPGIEQRFFGIKLVSPLVPDIPLIIRINQKIRALGHNLSLPIFDHVLQRNLGWCGPVTDP